MYIRRAINASVFCALTALGAGVSAQKADLEVGEVNRPELKWGPQILGFEIFSNVDYPKFAVTTVDLKFEGTYLNPTRRWKVNTVVIPGEHAAVKVPLDIPVNFGMAQIDLNVYDMVDTLDAIGLGTKIMSQSFQLRFKIPDELTPYLQEKLTFPPMVGNNLLLDNEFVRVMLAMLEEGKTIPEITRQAKTDSSFVERNINELARGKYILRKDKVATLTFPFLNVKQAEKIKPLAEKTSDQLVSVIKKNLPLYKVAVDSMIRAGKIAKDSNDFLNGGRVLYYRYPVIGGLALWTDLGQKFITDTILLDIYKGSDPCNAYIPQYMYAVQGGDFFNGHQYFNYSNITGHLVMQFGDQIPRVKCPDQYPFPSVLGQGSDWNYEADYMPEFFSMDTSVTQRAVRALDEGTQPIIAATRDELKKGLDAIGPNLYTTGSRLWFWNLVASRTLDKLVETGVVARQGNGQFRLEENP